MGAQWRMVGRFCNMLMNTAILRILWGPLSGSWRLRRGYPKGRIFICQCQDCIIRGRDSMIALTRRQKMKQIWKVSMKIFRRYLIIKNRWLQLTLLMKMKNPRCQETNLIIWKIHKFCKWVSWAITVKISRKLSQRRLKELSFNQALSSEKM